MIRRRGQGPVEDSSSDEEDAFAAMSRKKTKRSKSEPVASQARTTSEKGSANNQLPKEKNLPVSLTSSMKRHHKTNDSRKARMDALLQELEAEKRKLPREKHRFVPEKKGSFVEPSEEHLTTNIFVGNLAPSITEEDLTSLFLQFGDLYSIKIMWPRTPAERSRKRNTGFVCFMNREDAEEAMEACNETDPFNVGRSLMMRWGKNVKKSVRQGTGGGLAINPMQKCEEAIPEGSFGLTEKGASSISDESSERQGGPPSFIEVGPHRELTDLTKFAPFDSSKHLDTSFNVEAPEDINRFRFISKVASFVAKDGASLEQRLIQSEEGNVLFNFLSLDNATDLQIKEHLFYRWRVYSLCQGDTVAKWRQEPFAMFHPHGRYWLPPPMNAQVAREESIRQQDREVDIRQKKGNRKHGTKREYMTGRQLERARGTRRKGNRKGLNWGFGSKLTKEEHAEFNELVRKKLTVSRESICAAMAFCFERSGSAEEITMLLKDALLDDSPIITVDMRIARLYLISDILFNSQQPGVKNAFVYRDALEKMAPDIFRSLGKHGGGNVGRMTMNKLKTAVSCVLGAWTEWSVYNPAFLDELEAAFQGKELKKPDIKEVAVQSDAKAKEIVQEHVEEVTINKPRGGWTDVSEEDANENGAALSSAEMDSKDHRIPSKEQPNFEGTKIREKLGSQPSGADGELGAKFGIDIDGSPLDETVEDRLDSTNKTVDDIDGDPLDEDVDGGPLDEDMDGVPFDETAEKQTTAQPIGAGGREPADMQNVDSEDIDGEEISGGDVDGESLDNADIDGEHIDGEGIDGKDIDGEDIDGEELDLE